VFWQRSEPSLSPNAVSFIANSIYVFSKKQSELVGSLQRRNVARLKPLFGFCFSNDGDRGDAADNNDKNPFFIFSTCPLSLMDLSMKENEILIDIFS
jgi:hypothetical protein